MNDFTNKIRNIKKSRDKQVKKLSKLLNLLVSAEWNMVALSYENNDRAGLLASKSVSDAVKNIQSAISQLILADFSELATTQRKGQKEENIQPLKKVVLGKK